MASYTAPTTDGVHTVVVTDTAAPTPPVVPGWIGSRYISELPTAIAAVVEAATPFKSVDPAVDAVHAVSVSVFDLTARTRAPKEVEIGRAHV